MNSNCKSLTPLIPSAYWLFHFNWIAFRLKVSKYMKFRLFARYFSCKSHTHAFHYFLFSCSNKQSVEFDFYPVLNSNLRILYRFTVWLHHTKQSSILFIVFTFDKSFKDLLNLSLSLCDFYDETQRLAGTQVIF